MTAGQRAFAALDFLPYEEAEALSRKSLGGKGGLETCAGSGTSSKEGRSRDIVAARFSISGQRISEAKKVRENALDLTHLRLLNEG